MAYPQIQFAGYQPIIGNAVQMYRAGERDRLNEERLEITQARELRGERRAAQTHSLALEKYGLEKSEFKRKEKEAFEKRQLTAGIASGQPAFEMEEYETGKKAMIPRERGLALFETMYPAEAKTLAEMAGLRAKQKKEGAQESSHLESFASAIPRIEEGDWQGAQRRLIGGGWEPEKVKIMAPAPEKPDVHNVAGMGLYQIPRESGAEPRLLVGANPEEKFQTPSENVPYIMVSQPGKEPRFIPNPGYVKPDQRKTGSAALATKTTDTFLLGQGYNLADPEIRTQAYEWFGTPTGQTAWFAYLEKTRPPTYAPTGGVGPSGAPEVFNVRHPEDRREVGAGQPSSSSPASGDQTQASPAKPDPYRPKPVNAPVTAVDAIAKADDVVNRLESLAKEVEDNPNRKEWLGPIDATKNKALSFVSNRPGFSTFRTQVESVRDLVYALSGKQINETELDWILGALPTLSNQDQNFVAKARAAARWIRGKNELFKKGLKDSGHILTPIVGGGPTTVPDKTQPLVGSTTPSGRIRVVGPSGQRGTIPAEQLNDALREGYRRAD